MIGGGRKVLIGCILMLVLKWWFGKFWVRVSVVGRLVVCISV